MVELTQSEAAVYIVGAKSYGRAPTFLMATGYEQVRSIAAELAGDPVAAREVRLVLPETGVCSTDLLFGAEAGSSCCGGPAAMPAHAVLLMRLPRHKVMLVAAAVRNLMSR